jgi:anti-sigma factor RsiW
LQDYLDGTLDKQESLRTFLHLRNCPACERECARLQALFALLDDLPQHEAPEDFDARVLAAVPYQQYRAMEPLRRDRVPVYLEEHFLPAWVRAPAARAAGLAVTALAVVGLAADWWSDQVAVASLTACLPELLVRLQDAGRLVVRVSRRAAS